MLNVLLLASLAILAFSALLVLKRIVTGSTLPDRVVAIDLMGVLIVGFVVVGAAATGSYYFLDIAIVIALISFVGTVAYARYVEMGEAEQE